MFSSNNNNAIFGAEVNLTVSHETLAKVILAAMIIIGINVLAKKYLS